LTTPGTATKLNFVAPPFRGPGGHDEDKNPWIATMKPTTEGATMTATTPKAEPPRPEPQGVKGIRKLVAGSALLMIALSTLTADAAQWNGFERRDFVVDGRKCLLVLPNTPAPGKPWIWRMEFFGHEPQGDIALLGKGFHVAYMNVENMYGAPVALDHMDKFHAHLTMQFGLAPKTVLEGFSRGGLFAFNWATRNPDKVAAIYADAPVCDFKSWPGGKGKSKGSAGDYKRLLQVYGLTEEQAMAYKGNPVDNLAPLAKAKIPLLHVVGAADTTVPVAENTEIVARRYRELGGLIEVISKPNCDHHPHSLKDPKPIVDFVLKHTGLARPPAATSPKDKAD